LIGEVLARRCKGNPLTGMPKIVATVDKYQGEQNDCKSILNSSSNTQTNTTQSSSSL
jgi:hypothetical protein